MSTRSMTWMIPLRAAMSVLTTVAPPTVTVEPVTLMGSDDPSSVFASVSVTAFAAGTRPATTW